jgi:hypothetical protein
MQATDQVFALSLQASLARVGIIIFQVKIISSRNAARIILLAF